MILLWYLVFTLYRQAALSTNDCIDRYKTELVHIKRVVSVELCRTYIVAAGNVCNDQELRLPLL